MAGDTQGGLDWLDDSGGETASTESGEKKALSKDVLDWLSGSGDAGETMQSPDGAMGVMEGLDWMAEDNDEAPSGGTTTVGGTTAVGDTTTVAAAQSPANLIDPNESSANVGGESMFSSALDDFFSGMEDSGGGGVSGVFDSNVEMSASTARRVRDNRFDRIVSTLLRYLTRKDPIREGQLDSIFRLTVGRVVDALNAEVVAVFFKTPEGKTVVGNLFYSKTLFKKQPELETPFLNHINTLQSIEVNESESVACRSMESKRSVTVLDVSNDKNYVQAVGKGTGWTPQTMLAVPIVDGDEVFGAIQLMNKQDTSGEEFFSFQDSKLVEEMAGYIARIIHRVRDPKLVPDESEMSRYVARLSKSETVDLLDEDMEFDDRLLDVVGKANVRKYKIIPLKKLSSSGLRVAMSNPLDFQRRAGFEAKTEYTIEEALVAPATEIEQTLDKIIPKDKKASVDASEMSKLAGDLDGKVESIEVEPDEDEDSAPIIKLANRIIEDAYARGASDIHIEPYEDKTRVRYRIDGVCHEVLELPQSSIGPLASRIKIMSNLDISERRLPQDGKIQFKRWSRSGIDIDLRVATGKMAFGEKICMRLLVKGSISLGLDAMGFSPENMELYRFATKQPYGMVLNVGPTGSGKTTTLYSALTEVSQPTNNVHTAEDPIEYPLWGINQMQMQKEIGLTFASALKCFLRMDPDIILVGEIRDLETGEIAIEAALTGHLLFSTLHTNDAPGTVVRFIEMGIEPFMVSSSILLVCAQRLGRRLCPACKTPNTEPNEEELRLLAMDGRPNEDLFRHANDPKCPKCEGVGYKGRIGIHEVLTLNEEIRDAINRSASADELKRYAVENGMKTMFQDALWKTKTGLLDIEEVLSKVKIDGDVKRD